jgi:membrane-associated protease RseP (regulator of RpoE activity)
MLAGTPLIAQKSAAPRAHVAVLEQTPEVESSGRSYLGVGVIDLNSDRVQTLKLKDDRGVEVSQVDQDAPAGKAGLKEHDVIVAFNHTPVESQEQFKRLMRETPPGRTVSLDIVRDGQQQNLKVQLADRRKFESMMVPREPSAPFGFAMPALPAMPAMPDFPRAWTDQTMIRVRTNSGLTLESLTPQLGDYFGVKNGEGMLIRSVQKGSTAEAAGLHAGDVIVKVGEQKIADNSDLREALRNSKNGKVNVVIVRDKKEQTLSMAVPMRKGPDSSALYKDNSEDRIVAATQATVGAVEAVGPLIESGVEAGMWAADDALTSGRVEVEQAIQKAMEQLHRELIENRGEINRNISESVKVASAALKARGTEMERAMREAQRAIANIQISIGSDLQ